VTNESTPKDVEGRPAVPQSAGSGDPRTTTGLTTKLPGIDLPRLRSAYETARDLLLAECRPDGDGPAHWTGELSTSALSTATAVMALQMVRQGGRDANDYGIDGSFDELIRGGLDWLNSHQNEDGGWGDTVKSLSNISTTMLAHAVFHATGSAGDETFRETVARAQQYIDDAGGVPAVVKRYGKDKTFSVPILTHCALAGLVDWQEVTQLPFELACVPARFYAAVKMPVVSYALPALIAIGQVRHHFLSTWNPITLVLRKLAIKPSLRVLERIQPPNGGFLEAAPLTSFVTMSLAGMGLVDHVVVQRAVRFLADSVRPDGSWPIDTNLATWTTTLSINALNEDVPEELGDGLADWLLDQQYKETHPYTNAAPGGWAWTNLPGGVPDADDTPGAVLALLTLCGQFDRHQDLLRKNEQWIRYGRQAVGPQIHNAVRWLLDLQNRDGGFPTFCRGWGTLPFDRSSPDITAHCLRAIAAGKERFLWQILDWLEEGADVVRAGVKASGLSESRMSHAIKSGLAFLRKAQRPNGSWLPLWFGNQYGHDDGNPVYGTSRVLMAYRDLGLMDAPEAQRAAAWLASVQEGSPLTPALSPKGGEGARQSDSTSEPRNSSAADSSPLSSSPAHLARGWGGDAGIAPSVEETALAAEVLLDYPAFRENAFGGIRWLIERVEDGSVCEPSPIGFYFARLWYFESLYPLIFAVSALRRALEIADPPSEP
jgi:squalene-hopene/tetraprenyl-beta-curcumene cyclase